MSLRPAFILFTLYSLLLHTLALHFVWQQFAPPLTPPQRVGTPHDSNVILVDFIQPNARTMAASEDVGSTQRSVGESHPGGLAERAASMRMKPQRASMSAASARKPKPTRAPRMGLADRPSMVENFQERLSGETVQGGHQPTADATLARIYDRLARARHYPPLARARRHVGSPVVRFQIQPDGSIADLNLLTSCGIPLLDDAALQTVRRAAPFPYFPRPITVPIQYRLSPQ